MEWLSTLIGSTGTERAALVTAVGAAVVAILTAFRKRKDIDVEELNARIQNLTARVEALEGELDTTREELVAQEATTFRLRRVLAQNGLADPTLEAS